MASSPRQASAVSSNMGGRATLTTGIVYVLLLCGLFVVLWFVLERQNQATKRAERYSDAVVQVQKLLRGVNEIAVTDGASSSRALAAEALKALGEILTSSQAAAVEGAAGVDVSGLQTRAAAFIAEKDVSVSNVEAMISLGKISTEAGKLSDALTQSEAAALARAGQAATVTRWLVLVAALLALAGTAFIFWQFFRRVTRPLRSAVAVAERISGGDLSAAISLDHAGEVTRLMAALDTMQSNLAQLVQDARDTTRTVVDSAAQVSAGSGNLSARTEEQATTLEQTAASMEQIAASARDTVTNTRLANDVSHKAVAAARAGGDVVAAAIEKISAIQQSSRRIEEIITVIDSIAFQTNILALNAAVEAARAGEQGRGFAVVASEVRALAQRSATAAREIKTLIGSSVDHIASGTALINEAGGAMKNIVVANVEAVEVIGRIAAATADQAGSVEQINHAMSQMEMTTQQNAAMVEQAAAAAEAMRDHAQVLQGVVERFKLSSAFPGGNPLTVEAAPSHETLPSSAPRAVLGRLD